MTAGTPRRGPDVAGWYNRAVAFDFEGADATSGIAACPSVTYSGPDGGAATVTGRCTDRAGNGADRGFGIRYDATAPRSRARPRTGRRTRPDGTTARSRSASAEPTPTSGVDGCTTKTYAGPDAAAVPVTGTCTDKAGNVSGAGALAIKYDATAPAVTGGHAARVPDVGGWYNRAVPVTFSGTDATSGVDACTASPTAGRTARRRRSRARAATRPATSARPAQFGFKYDETAPVVTGAQPDRPPDHAGWFVSPVRFAFTATDATSGLDVCVPVDYTGPDGAEEVLVGRCRDRAGNGGTRHFTLDYDATPPALSLSAESGDGSVALSWQTSPDATSVEVSRTPGVGGRPSSVVFNGPGTSFVDGLVDNGTRYSYEVQVAGRRRQHQHAERRRVPLGSTAGGQSGRPSPAWSPSRRPPPRRPSAR